MGRNVTDHIICYRRGTRHKEMAAVLFALRCFVKNFTEGNDVNKIQGEIREGDKGRGTPKQIEQGMSRVKEEHKLCSERGKIGKKAWKWIERKPKAEPGYLKNTDLAVRYERSWDRTLTRTGTLTTADTFQQEGWEKEGRKSFQKQNSHYKNLHFPVVSPSLPYTDQLLGSRKSQF